MFLATCVHRPSSPPVVACLPPCSHLQALDGWVTQLLAVCSDLRAGSGAWGQRVAALS